VRRFCPARIVLRRARRRRRGPAVVGGRASQRRISRPPVGRACGGPEPRPTPPARRRTREPPPMELRVGRARGEQQAEARGDLVESPPRNDRSTPGRRSAAPASPTTVQHAVRPHPIARGPASSSVAAARGRGRGKSRIGEVTANSCRRSAWARPMIWALVWSGDSAAEIDEEVACGAAAQVASTSRRGAPARKGWSRRGGRGPWGRRHGSRRAANPRVHRRVDTCQRITQTEAMPPGRFRDDGAASTVTARSVLAASNTAWSCQARSTSA